MSMTVYPAIDLIAGRCVRLREGDFAQQTTYDADPIALARTLAADGARWLHIVDLDGAKSGRPVQGDLIRQMKNESGLPVQTGGGIRSAEMVYELIEKGVDRVMLGSLAMRDPETTLAIAQKVGADRVVLALDVKMVEGVTHLMSDGWRTAEPGKWEALLERYAQAGLKHLLCTDISKDGTLTGPNLTLYRELLTRCPQFQVQASGGVQSLEDLRQLAQLGVAGVVIGKALLEGRFTLAEALQC